MDLQALLQQSTVTSPSSSTSHGSALQSSTSSNQDLGKGHALQASSAFPSQVPWILDSGASHHMTSSKGVFSTLEASPIPHILMENNVALPVYKKILVHIQDGIFNDVLYVPSLSANLLLISQITCSGSGKIVEFTTDSIFIRDRVTGSVIATGTVDPSTCLYTFSHFFPSSPCLEHVSSRSQEHHVVQSGYLNLCIVPKIPVLTVTPHLVDSFSLPLEPTSSLPDPPALATVVAATSSLRIPFPHTFSSRHQLGFPVSPLIHGYPWYGPSFLPSWSSIGSLRVPLF